MSFILDALRKSEHERQRGAVPGISHVPFAAPRRETPRWMVGLVAALALALVALGGAWWRSSRTAPEAPAVAPVPLEIPPPAAPAAETRVAPADTRSEPAETRAAPDETRALRGEPPRAGAPEERSPLAPPITAPSPTEPPAQTAAAAVTPAPADDREDSSDEPPLPSPAALGAEGISVPQLHLELHAYSDRPAERFVFINGRKYVEGETLAEGPRLVAIQRTGVVLSQQGRRFLLTQ